jgi:hypothetical protein
MAAAPERRLCTAIWNASPVLRLAAKGKADFASWSMTWSPWGGWFLLTFAWLVDAGQLTSTAFQWLSP